MIGHGEVRRARREDMETSKQVRGAVAAGKIEEVLGQSEPKAQTLPATRERTVRTPEEFLAVSISDEK